MNDNLKPSVNNSSDTKKSENKAPNKIFLEIRSLVDDLEKEFYRLQGSKAPEAPKAFSNPKIVSPALTPNTPSNKIKGTFDGVFMVAGNKKYDVPKNVLDEYDLIAGDLLERVDQGGGILVYRCLNKDPKSVQKTDTIRSNQDKKPVKPFLDEEDLV